MRLEYLILTTSGPVVGDEEVTDRAHACQVLEDAVKRAFGLAHVGEHARAVRSLCAEMRLADLPFVFRTAAVSVTLGA
ncbi:hypothetical protein ACFYMO_00670 [Streptomyces sp. NPDC007025]|uniref:hypothetical protein n=1 Tax=Streptomyces sp. NPDC007025 TaxID=3364771 RepID=UPI0036773719